MRLQKVQDALNKKNIKFEYTEEDGCGSLDFMFRGLKFHVWEYEDNGWGAETLTEIMKRRFLQRFFPGRI